MSNFSLGEAHLFAIEKSRDEIAKIKTFPCEKYYATAWGVFVDKDDQSIFNDSSCLPYYCTLVDFAEESLKVEILGDKIVWLRHSNVELPEIYIDFHSNFGEGKSSLASISRDNTVNPQVVDDNANLVDFALGLFGNEISDWQISESSSNESNQTFWTAIQNRHPDINLSFRF